MSMTHAVNSLGFNRGTHSEPTCTLKRLMANFPMSTAAKNIETPPNAAHSRRLLLRHKGTASTHIVARNSLSLHEVREFG